MKKTNFFKQVALILLAVMMTSATAWAQEQQILRIYTTDDWNTFAANVSSGTNNYNGWIVTLENNITVTTTVGDVSNTNNHFRGTFNGQGNTLTFNSSEYLAPFGYTYNATIENLKVEGNIYTSDMYPGGIVGQQWGTLTLRNCRCSVNIHCSRAGECGAGGLVGYVSGSVNTVIEGCLFNGSLLSVNDGENLSTSCGGFIGYSISGTFNISNSLLAPTNVTIGYGSGDRPSYIFARSFNTQGNSSITNSYWIYPTEFGTYQGLRAHTITAGEHISVEFAGTETVYSSTGIRSYSNGGIRYGGVLYAGNNSDANYDVVSLTLNNTPEEGYVFDHYTASAGTLTGSDNPYSLTMPAEDVVINGVFIAPINYMNADGSIGYKAANEYTVLTGGAATSLEAGWYVVNSDIDYTGKVTLNGDVTIILCNGCTMNVGTEESPISGQGLDAQNLTIYGQTLDENTAGKLSVYCNDRWASACNATNYVQNSGNVVVVNTNNEAGGTQEGIGANITINGGKLYASADVRSLISSNININGGKVTTIGSIYALNNSTVTISWTNADDYVSATYYNGNVTLAKNFIYQNSVYAPGIVYDPSSTLGGKTLRPYGVNTLSVKGWGNSAESDHWVFIASPVATDGGVAFSYVDNLINTTTANYDLYRLNNTSWENSKNTSGHSDFTTLVNGRGYLYANKDDVTLTFSGTLNDATEQSVQVYEGYNLVGNPFPTMAYLNQSYYAMNADGSNIVATPMNISNPIMPCTSVIVEANPGTVTFSTKQPQQQSSGSNNGFLQVVLAEQVATRGGETTTMIDNAIVSFNEGDELGKFYFGEQDAKIYIPQDGKEYAIVHGGNQGVMPLNFEANENGEYTLTVSETFNSQLSTLHLIDNLTGADVDLLSTPSYQFTARKTDFASRFKLVFRTNGVDNTSDSDNAFAYYSDGQIYLVGDEDTLNATMQVIDITGRIVVRSVGANVISTNGLVPGVYTIQMVQNNQVRNQKIIIK